MVGQVQCLIITLIPMHHFKILQMYFTSKFVTSATFKIKIVTSASKIIVLMQQLNIFTYLTVLKQLQLVFMHQNQNYYSTSATTIVTNAIIKKYKTP